MSEDRIDFDSSADAALRALRKGSRRTGSAQVVAYTAPGGSALALTGDSEAPYVKVINSVDAPVQVSIAGVSGSLTVQGNVAAGDADAGNPVKVGGVATGFAGQAAVTLGDRTNFVSDVMGRQYNLVGGMIGHGEIAFDVTTAPPVGVGGTAAPTAGGFGAVTALDRAVFATDLNGRQLVVAVGAVAAGAVDDANGGPVKVGGVVAANITGLNPVDAGDVSNAAVDVRGALMVTLSGSKQWGKYNSTLGGAGLTANPLGTNGVVGRISITSMEAVALYAIVFDANSATGDPVDRFYIPANGTTVRDYTTEGGLGLTTGCFIALSTAANAVTAPATGGFFHVIQQ